MFLYFSTPPISHGRQEGAVDTLAALLEAHADDIDNGMLQQGLGTCHIDEHTHSKHTYVLTHSIVTRARARSSRANRTYGGIEVGRASN